MAQSSILMKDFCSIIKEECGLDIKTNFYDHNMVATGTGSRLWIGGWLLNKYIIKNYKEFEGKNILELAAGTGGGGLLLAKYNIKHLTQTDFDDECLKNMKENIELNKDKINSNLVSVEKLDLSKEQTIKNFYENSTIKEFDLIIISDFIWKSELAKMWLKAIDVLFKINPNAEIRMFHEHYPDVEIFEEEMEGNPKYEMKRVEAKDFGETFSLAYIYYIKLKK
jgi:predicted nicotinamide N-methyase